MCMLFVSRNQSAKVTILFTKSGTVAEDFSVYWKCAMISPSVCVSFLKPLLHLKSFILIDSLAESQSDIYF